MFKNNKSKKKKYKLNLFKNNNKLIKKNKELLMLI